MKKALACLLALCLTLSCAAALADTITLSGTVVATETVVVTAPIGGTLSKITAAAGDRVEAGATLAELKTSVVCAQEDGVARVFGDPGDSAEAVAARYGAVVYVEPSYRHTISATTRTAYDSESCRIIHPGEKVFLRSYSNAKNTGRGVVTSVSGSSYTVEIISGSFSSGETVNVFRKANYVSSSRLGRGSVAHTDPKAYTAEGSIVSYYVKNGQSVKKGDPLFDTLTGTYDNTAAIGNRITAGVSGIVSAISVATGSTLAKDAAVAEIYPDSAMRVQVSVAESDLRSLMPGSKVTVEFPYLQDNTVVVKGTVERVSYLADGANPDANDEEASSDEAYFLVNIAFEPLENVRYGMSAVVTSEQEQAAEAASDDPAEDADDEPAEETENQPEETLPEDAPAFPEEMERLEAKP